MPSATKTVPSPSIKRASSAKMAKSASNTNNSDLPDVTSYDEINRDIIADNNSPVDRRVLTEAFVSVFYRYNIDQAELAESCGLSATTISQLVSRGKLVTWDTWQTLIAGLIKYRLTHAYAFWIALPPCIRNKIADNTANQVILSYIAEYKKLTIENEQSIVENVNELLSQLDHTRIDDNLLSKICLPSNNSNNSSLTNLSPSSDSKLGSDQVNSGNAILHCHGGTQTVSQLTVFVFPSNSDDNKKQITELMSNLIKNTGVNTTSSEESDIKNNSIN
jgi:plasmid maintenance system antidote protein VapI